MIYFHKTKIKNLKPHPSGCRLQFEVLRFRCGAPAVDDHGTGVRKFSLLRVDLSDEAEDSTWLLRDPVVGPAQILEVPYCTGKTGLGEKKKSAYQHFFI